MTRIRERLSPDESERLIAKYRPQRARLKWFRKQKWWHSYALQLRDGCTEIGCVYPDTHFLMILFFHECAHVIDRYVTTPDKHPTHEYEYAAERTAMTWWRNEGFVVPPQYIRCAKTYIRGCIARDRRRGIQIKPHISRWAKP